MIHTIQDLFSDRAGKDSLDIMYPAKIKTKTPRDLFRFFFDKGDYTSVVIDGLTLPLMTPDGLSLFSPSHTSASYTSMTFSNVVSGRPALSVESIDYGRSLLNNLFSVPDTLITYSDKIMCQKATEVIREFKIRTGVELQHVIIPLKDQMIQYRWFLADSRKAAGHHKKLGMDYHEIAMMDWSWIVASLSVTCPSY